MPDISLATLSKKQTSILKSSVKAESEALREFWISEFEESGELDDLDTKKKVNTINHLVKLFKEDFDDRQIKKMVELFAADFITDLEDEVSPYFDESSCQVELLDRTGIDHTKFEWTIGLVKEASEAFVKEKTDKAIKLRKFEHGLKSAVERGDPIYELEPSVKYMIAEHLRAMIKKTKKKSKKKPKKKPKKTRKRRKRKSQ